MNYLSHHAVVRAVYPGAPPAFVVGNVLPDLLAVSGEGRLRARHVAETPPGVDPDLVRGIRLHLATDQRFHGHPLFLEEMARASAILRAAPFATPPRRVFFLAHAFVELAMDGLLARVDRPLVDDFYERFAQGDPERVVADTAALLGKSGPLSDLTRTLARFQEARYLYAYAEASGMAGALERLAHRAALTNLFELPTDRAVLASCFDAYLPELDTVLPTLLFPPETTLWYNSGELLRSEGDDHRAD